MRADATVLYILFLALPHGTHISKYCIFSSFKYICMASCEMFVYVYVYDRIFIQ